MPYRCNACGEENLKIPLDDHSSPFYCETCYNEKFKGIIPKMSNIAKPRFDIHDYIERYDDEASPEQENAIRHLEDQ